jgi:hypothetical protein
MGYGVAKWLVRLSANVADPDHISKSLETIFMG